MSLNDNYFGCAETPLWMPNMFDMSQISNCDSCILRLTASAGGVGRLMKDLTFQESPLTTLSVNGIQHNLIISYLVIPGAHKIGNNQSPYPAEAIFIFQNIQIAKKIIILCIPLDIGQGRGNSYFSTLTSEIRNDRPTLASLLDTNGSFLTYDGVSLLSRNAKEPRPRAICETPTVSTFYVSLNQAFIKQSDFSRIKEFSHGVGPPAPATSALPARIIKLCLQIDGIQLDSSAFSSSSGSDQGISTKAMKCYRLNAEKDIVDNKVYIDGKNKPGTRLSSELARAASGEDLNVEVKESSIKPGDVEKALGIILGIIVGLVITSTLAVIIYKFVFKNYLEGQKLYNVPTATDLAIPMPSLPGFFSKK